VRRAELGAWLAPISREKPWKREEAMPRVKPRRREPEDERDPAQTSEPIDSESWGKIVEVCPDDSVDGDFNGQPELESLADTEQWEGVDALQGMEGREKELVREPHAAEEVLAEAVAARRSVLVERIDEASELGLAALFEATIAATEPSAGSSPVVLDEETLRDHLTLIDAAIDELERRSEE
jgi:hypothetical protein